ncbi:MAG: hypothetical protein AWU55_1737 [Halomonadaceae bacterium T82-2]|nr:MAG: hypothetical protein AWU55_1737 [Halomonadaceae bacterium T82-2]
MTRDPSLEAFCAFYNKLDKTCTNRLAEFYTADVSFRDPWHRIEGREALIRYFDTLYERVGECRFTFAERLRDGDQAFVRWILTVTHPALAGGDPVTVEGCSYLRFEAERVREHHDYFDAGALLYEHVPLLGGAIRYLKRRLA